MRAAPVLIGVWARRYACSLGTGFGGHPLTRVVVAQAGHGDTLLDAPIGVHCGTTKAMTLTELKGKYARLREEINSLGAAGSYSEARRARLMYDLEQIEAQVANVNRLSLSAPTLRDVVAWVEPAGHGVDMHDDSQRRVA
jgi:hypothetical protein